MPFKRRANNKRRVRKRGGNRGYGKRYRAAYNLNTLQIANTRPSTMRIPIQIKQQYFGKAPSSAPFSTVMFWRMNSPNGIFQSTNPLVQLTADTTLGNNRAQEIDTLKSMYSKGVVLGAKLEWSLKFLDHRTDVSDTLPDTAGNPNQQIQGVYSGIARDLNNPTIHSQPSSLITNHNFKENRVLAGSFHTAGASTAHSPYTGRGATKRLQGSIKYSPRKQLGVKDTQDVDSLEIAPLNSMGNEQTFACLDIQQAYDTGYAVGGALVPDTHNDFYLDVKITYMLQVSEPAIHKLNNLAGVGAFAQANVVPGQGGTFA